MSTKRCFPSSCSRCSAALCLLFGLFHFTTSYAWSPVYPADRRALCLDLDTGALRWQVFQTNTERILFEAYREGIVAYFKQRGREEAIPVFLDPNTGKRMEPFVTRFSFPQAELRLAHSYDLFPRQEFKLDNGWITYGLPRINWRNTTDNLLYFFDADSLALRWKTVLPKGTDEVRILKDMLLYTKSEGFQESLRKDGRPIPKDVPPIEFYDDRKQLRSGHSLSFDTFDGVIVAESHGYLFVLDPASGRITEQWHYWSEVKGTSQASEKTPEIVDGNKFLVLGKAPLLLCLELAGKKIRWQYDTDLGRSYSQPMIYRGRVYTSGGEKHELLPVQIR